MSDRRRRDSNKEGAQSAEGRQSGGLSDADESRVAHGSARSESLMAHHEKSKSEDYHPASAEGFFTAEPSGKPSPV